MSDLKQLGQRSSSSLNKYDSSVLQETSELHVFSILETIPVFATAVTRDARGSTLFAVSFEIAVVFFHRFVHFPLRNEQDS